MDAKKILQGLFMGLNAAEAYQNSGGELLDPSLALAFAFSRRFSDEDSFEKSIDSKIFLSRKDFPLMKEREEARFLSGKNYLRGYLYRVDLAKGLVIYVHGIKGQADDYYAIGENYFLSHGYDVFAFDLTASGRSEGLGIDGLHQSALDVKAAYEYILSRGDFTNMRKYIFGHSWGAYGAAGALSFPSVRPNAIAAMSGFDTPIKEMLGLPSSYIGFEIKFKKEELEEALRKRGGEYWNLSASKALLSSNVPSLLIQGENDATVPLKASLYEASNGDNVTKILVAKRGHADIFLCDESLAYASKVKAMGKEITERYGKDMSLVPSSVIEEFTASFDRRMTSFINVSLFDAIDEYFQSH